MVYEGLGYTVSRGNAVRIVLRPPGNSATERQNCHRLACGRHGSAFSSMRNAPTCRRIRCCQSSRGRSTSQSGCASRRSVHWAVEKGCPLATVVRPNVRHVDLDSVIEPLEISNQRLERKAFQLSTAELRDARPIRSDTPRDVISVAALEQRSEHLAQLSLERRDRIDSRRGVLVSHGATLSHATRLVVIRRTHTSRHGSRSPGTLPCRTSCVLRPFGHQKYPLKHAKTL